MRSALAIIVVLGMVGRFSRYDMILSGYTVSGWQLYICRLDSFGLVTIQWRSPEMRKAMPRITESADELQRRMKSESDLKKRQRLHAFYLAASGQARQRQEIAALLGVHRHSVAAWFRAYVEGGLDHAMRYQRPRPPVHQRITAAAFAALQDTLKDPYGCASYHQIRVWLAEAHQVFLAYSSVHELVRDKLCATPKRPRPSHTQKP